MSNGALKKEITVSETYENVRIESGLITQKDADALLDSNTNNRNVTASNVNRIKTDLQNGDFIWSNDMVCVCDDGLLLNGQHRLMAISETGIPAWLTIAFNVPRHSVIDKNKPRSDGEQLKIMGILNETLSSSKVMSVTKHYLKAKAFLNASIPMQLIGEFVSKYGENLYLSVLISQRGGRKPRLNKASAQCAIFAALELGYSEDELTYFTSIVNSGFGAIDKRDNAALALMNTYIDLTTQSARIGGDAWLTRLVERALWDFLNNKSIRSKRYDVSKLEGHPLIEQCEANIKDGKVI